MMQSGASIRGAEKPLAAKWHAGRQWKHARWFVVQVWHRFLEDECLTLAASLSYATLIALVPLSAVGFALLAAFPVFEEVQRQIQALILQNFLPSAIDTVQEYLNRFAGRARDLTAVGVVGLAVTAMLLFYAVEAAMNTIFRVSRARPLVPRFMVFWAILTLGPLLMGASFSMGASLVTANGMVAEEAGWKVAAPVLPTLLSITAFTLFYAIIPYRPVRFRNALIGAALAGLVFSLLRYLFTLYVTTFPAYQTLYGALATVPMFLFWVYLSWAVILAGAVITAELPAWGIGEVGSGYVNSPGARLVLALGILAELYRATQRGGGVGTGQLLGALPAHDRAVEDVLRQLRQTNYVDATSRGRWLPARDLHATTLYDLFTDLSLNVGPEVAIHGTSVAPWRERLDRILAADAERQRELMTVSLKDLLMDDPEMRDDPEARLAASPRLTLRSTP